VDRKTFKTAERILLYLKENEMMLTRGAILVGNKTDLERQREVSTQGQSSRDSDLQLGDSPDELL
jgi:GTPase SAR1 family protein